MAQPTTVDFSAPFDPTGYASITGAQLLQFLQGLFPNVNEGIALVTTDIATVPQVPDAVTNTKWQRYLWIRQSVSSVGLYVWNTAAASDVTLLQWQSVNIAGIGAGSIQGFMLADNTIPSVKIISLDYSKLTGTPSGLPPSGNAGGSLVGTYPNPSIAAGAVVTANIALLNITNALIAVATIDITKLAPVSGSAKDMARVNAGATGMEAFTPPVLFTSGVVVPTANALKIPQVNAGGTDFQMVSLTTVGARILQIIETQDTTADTTALNNALTVLPDNTTCKLPGGLTVAITPVSTTSTLFVELGMVLGNTSTPGATIAALFQDAVVNALAASTMDCENSARPVICVLRYKVVSGSLTARTFKAGFSGVAGNTRYNSTDGATKLFGGALGTNSWLRVTEYI